jgi:hypothetical protein
VEDITMLHAVTVKVPGWEVDVHLDQQEVLRIRLSDGTLLFAKVIGDTFYLTEDHKTEWKILHQQKIGPAAGFSTHLGH